MGHPDETWQDHTLLMNKIRVNKKGLIVLFEGYEFRTSIRPIGRLGKGLVSEKTFIRSYISF
jgi:hypothetical protein